MSPILARVFESLKLHHATCIDCLASETERDAGTTSCSRYKWSRRRCESMLAIARARAAARPQAWCH